MASFHSHTAVSKFHIYIPQANTTINPHFSLSLDKQVMELTLDHYTETLLDNLRALQYLEKRGINNTAAIKQFRLGFSDRTLGLCMQHMNRTNQEHSRGALQRLGLLKDSGHEFFRGALFIPFFGDNNECNGGYGRRICAKLKANSAYHLHWLTETTTFFNQQALKQNNTIILCKNPIDALSWWCNGFHQTISFLGSGEITDSQLDALGMHNIQQVYIALGSHLEDIRASQRIAILLQQRSIASRQVIYPDGLDANGLIQISVKPAADLQECLDLSLVFNVNMPNQPFSG